MTKDIELEKAVYGNISSKQINSESRPNLKKSQSLMSSGGSSNSSSLQRKSQDILKIKNMSADGKLPRGILL